jgi:hypothetical protein
MNSHTIASLLGERGAWLKGEPADSKLAQSRATLLRAIASSYSDFEKLRDGLLRQAVVQAAIREEKAYALLQELSAQSLVRERAGGYVVSDAPALRFLSGGWLEELAWLAAIEGGAHEAVFGQVLGWRVEGFHGENEIDLIARHHGKLSFVSCKAFRSELDMHDKKQRNRLMEAIHEADNLVDHFGRNDEKVAVLVTTDLIDEVKGSARYSALMGKATILKVKLISLEHLEWNTLVSTMSSLWEV